MKAAVTSTVTKGVGIVVISSPPVNALGKAVRREMSEQIAAMLAADTVSAIVIIGAGRLFSAGADITEIGLPEEQPKLADLFALVENSPKPVVAAIGGFALGGGLELALVCHYRVAERSAYIGLPEVHLGLLPGAGGTQRLPRLTGVDSAIEIMTSGRQVHSGEAAALGVVDAVVEDGTLADSAIAFARQMVSEPLVRVRDRGERLHSAQLTPGYFDEKRAKLARCVRGFKAPTAIVDAVQAAVELSFEAGLAREWSLLEELASGRESQALRHHFFAEREAGKVDGLSDADILPIMMVGVIGAGTMGGGIAMNFLNIGIPVQLIDMTQEALDRGVDVIRRNYENSVRRGRMTDVELAQRMALLDSRLDWDGLGQVDLVIEAVYEDLEIKKKLFARLDQVASRDAILASNTSFLDLDEIANATGRPESVVGLHFFSPANVMRLLEVVRGARTSPAVIATAMRLGKRIEKVAVLSGVCDGFIANRAMKARADQADALILEGTPVEAIDAALVEFGFAMGHFQVMDLVGLDVIGRASTAVTVMGEMVARGRLGQKTRSGYYDYDDDRRASASTVAAGIISDVAGRLDVALSPAKSNQAIIERLLFPVVNEASRILEEGMAQRASDIDVALIAGYGWPLQSGGPMFWADSLGLGAITKALDAMADRHGEELRPSSLLRDLAGRGKGFFGV